MEDTRKPFFIYQLVQYVGFNTTPIYFRNRELAVNAFNLTKAGMLTEIKIDPRKFDSLKELAINLLENENFAEYSNQLYEKFGRENE